MRHLTLRLLVTAAVLPLSSVRAAAQQGTPPSRQDIEALQRRPDLVARLKEQLAATGMTPDQLRARLRAEGYSERLLDPYLPGAAAPADSLAPGADVLAAVRSLGIADTAAVDARQLRGRYGSDALDTAAALAGLADSLRAEQRSRDSLVRPDSGFTVFGLDVFRRQTSLFEPNLAGPVDASYRLGPGDRLVLIITGEAELAHALDVTREGFVVIPQVGQLYVASLSLGQLEDLLYARLGRVYPGLRRGAGASTQLSVSVARLRSNQVFVVGDAAAPGSYRISSAGTALTALYAAAGPSDNGTLRRIEVRRGGRTVSVLDVYDYLVRGDASKDVRLENGDIVFVPVHGPRVRIVGEVVRPGTYELKPGEALCDALQAAGGFTAQAARRRVQIERILPPQQRGDGGRDRVVIDVASDELVSGYGPALALEPADIIRVFPVVTRVRSRITVSGNVWAPGPQGYTAGMTLSQALRAAGVRADTYLGQVLITRVQPDSTLRQLRATLRDTTGAVAADVPLQEDDEVRVFSVAEFRPERFVTVNGAVRRPGAYPYRDGMTLRDLVLVAGGLDEGAYLKEAEVARLPESRAGGTTAQTVRVPLDSSYVFERQAAAGAAAPASSAEVPLRPYDNVLILQQPGWELERTVVVSGEVQFPGRYTLASKGERLADVIARAGGLTPTGYADGLYFYRSARHVGRIGVDLPAVLKDRRHRDNIVLQPGDSIHLPEYSPVVDVTGAVNSPVAVAYVPGRNIDFYIRAAGGTSSKADARRMYVTQASGKVETVKRRRFAPDTKPVPQAGAVVYVAQRDPADRPNYLAAAGAVAQIMGPLVAIVALILR